MSKVQVLGISGSLRRDSHNTRLLRAAGELLPPGAELVIWDGVASVPAFDADCESQIVPPAVASLREAVAASDALLIATPEYNNTVPGALKNALDWLSRPLETTPIRGLPAAVTGASTGMFGAVWAQADMRKVLTRMGARVIDRELPVPQADERFDGDGRLIDEEVAESLQELLRELVASAEALEEARHRTRLQTAAS